MMHVRIPLKPERSGLYVIPATAEELMERASHGVSTFRKSDRILLLKKSMKSLAFCHVHNAAITAGLLLLLMPNLSSSLELLPSVPQHVLSRDSSLNITCSGWSPVSWHFRRDENIPRFGTEEISNTSSMLRLEKVSWRHTGVYVCIEKLSNQSREVAVFVPDPDVWFLQNDHIMVTKTREEGTIPCLVTDPSITVSLYEKDMETAVQGSYNPTVGYSAALEDRTYKCRGEKNGEYKESIPFYVFSILAPEVLDPYINASRTVLKQGETLHINCTVHGVELVYFSWDFPDKDVGDVEPLTDILSSNSIRSFLNITDVTLARSGEYVCHIDEGVKEQSASASINITVLERGFVRVSSTLKRNVSAQLGENVELKVEIEAYPKPTVSWKKDGVLLKGHTLKQEHETRFVTTLMLVRIRLEQMGLYKVTIDNEDDLKEMTFDLEVKVPPQITELSDHHLPEKKHAVTCVAEGVPAPSIQWFSCSSSWCSNRSAVWSPLLEDPESISIQTSVTYNSTRRINTVMSQVTIVRPELLSIRCEARNERGAKARDIKLINGTLSSQGGVLAAVLAMVIISIIFIIILIAVCRKKPRYETRWKVIESVSLDGHEYIYVDPIHLPYDLAWEMPRDSLVLVEATAYGLGFSQSATKVAVKMLKSTARRSETQALMSELKIMSHLGPHLNIVNLLGACTKQGPLYLVTEYCRYGDLVDYLHRNKQSFLQYYTDKNNIINGNQFCNGNDEPIGKEYVSFGSKSDGGYIDMTKDEQMEYVPMQELTDTIKYAEIQAPPSPYQQDIYQEQGHSLDLSLVISDSPHLSYIDLVGFSYQVAKGMEFLASKNFLVVSLGGTPYPDLPMNELFYSALKRGYRMAKPSHASEDIYEVMRKCWDEKFEKRPEFSILVNTMENMLSEGYKKRYSQVSESFLKSNHPAVSRAKPHLPSPFPESFTLNPSPNPRPPTIGDPDAPQNDYIIPLPDPPKLEEDMEGQDEMGTSESPMSSFGSDEETISIETPSTEPEREELLPEQSGSPEVEESFL
ncbi:hypothetical protein DNTS_030142 [Danionella cerebrum]|uniref:receptor protein-tyrosine kinase n=1 Tax=Danionella cerebrum TaxID=2873325 RepID=A0A553QNJ9_9TELE|nr:hypothetical protein DNTS_030142 [Danionella translucida]